MACVSCLVSSAVGLLLLYVVWRPIAKLITRSNASYATQHDRISETPSTGKRIAVIGSGISGVQAMKACLSIGADPVCFEADEDMGGFWRYKDDEDKDFVYAIVEEPLGVVHFLRWTKWLTSSRISVYKSTHIDTDRDLNSFGDRPWSPDAPVFIHNSQLLEYLRQNVAEFGLEDSIRYNCRVQDIRYHSTDADGNARWSLTWDTINPRTGAVRSTSTDVFDGVLVCTGRHGGGGYIPAFKGLEKFKGKAFHSNRYKFPAKHGIDASSRVAVVGIGNSGVDIVTEVAEQTYLVARTGGWIAKLPHGEKFFSRQVMDSLTAHLLGLLPWWVASSLAERMLFKKQDVLNKHGLKPEHKFMQQHLIVTGLCDDEHTLHDELERGHITVRKGIQEFTEDGIIFVGESEVTPVDVVVFATGYRQAVNFVDPSIVDMRYERKGNDVMLFKYIFPVPSAEYEGKGIHTLGFINYVQSATFMCAEIQARLYVAAFEGKYKLPSSSDQLAELKAVRTTLCAQYMDRQQLRVQAGLNPRYYHDLAVCIGCYPSFWKLLTTRPTAFWHAWLCPGQGLQYRLVGPGRLEKAEEWMEGLYQSRFYGTMPDGTPKKGPSNRGLIGSCKAAAAVFYLSIMALYTRVAVKHARWGSTIQDKLEENLAFAATDSVPHCLDIGEDSSDVAMLKEQA